jgi:hypothetical protein
VAVGDTAAFRPILPNKRTLASAGGTLIHCDAQTPIDEYADIQPSTRDGVNGAVSQKRM